MSAAASDIGEEERRDRRGTRERRAGWKDERNVLASAVGPQRWAVVLGPPGQGKSELLKMTVREMAAEAKRSLLEQTASLSQIPLLVRMNFEVLTSGDGTVPEDSRTVEVARNPNAVLKRFAFGSAHKDDAKNEQAGLFLRGPVLFRAAKRSTFSRPFFFSLDVTIAWM